MTIENYINKLVSHIFITNSIGGITNWFSTLHITGAGLIIIAFFLLFVGKKLMSGVVNLAIMILLLVGVASVLGINLFKLIGI